MWVLTTAPGWSRRPSLLLGLLVVLLNTAATGYFVAQVGVS